MKRFFAGCIVLVSGLALAQTWQFAYQPVRASYVMYGGGLGDPHAPKPGGRHIAFNVTGPAAKEMFASLGPDLKDACGAEDGNRIRRRSELTCSFSPKDGYHCAFGFDLATGKSIGGSIC